MLQIAFNKLASPDIKLIIAPHEIHGAHLDELTTTLSSLHSILRTQPLHDSSLTSNILDH